MTREKRESVAPLYKSLSISIDNRLEGSVPNVSLFYILNIIKFIFNLPLFYFELTYSVVLPLNVLP